MNRKKKYMTRIVAVLLFFALVCSGEKIKTEGKQKIRISQTKLSLQVGKAKKLSVTGTKKKITWSSSKKAVATVSQKGKVTAKKKGQAKITAKVAGRQYICQVTVWENKPKQTAAPSSGYTFRYESLLLEHYQKHGIAMGYKSPEEYVAGANRVIKNPASLHKLEAEDGDHVYYLEATNEIVFLSVDGYIRTYFSPDNGIAYFNRQ